VPAGAASARLPAGLAVEYFDFAPSLAEHVAGADLVISHAGVLLCVLCSKFVCWRDAVSAPSCQLHKHSPNPTPKHPHQNNNKGSGSIFEALTQRKALIVVPNPLLMDNHQAELGQHLAAQGVLVRRARWG
jgi:beta-1,4-N-acetylglucosaminyltransferase